MVVRRYYDVDPTHAQQSMERNRTTVVPLLSQQPGASSYYTIESDDGSVVSIAVYNSNQEAEHSNQIAAEWVKQNSAQYVPANRRRSPQGEVLIHQGRE